MTYAQVIDNKVVAIFSCDQDETVWDGVSLLDDDDQRLIEFLARAQIKEPGE